MGEWHRTAAGSLATATPGLFGAERHSSGLDQIDIPKPAFAQYAFTALQSQRLAPQWARIDTGMELTVLAARIAGRRQLVEQVGIEFAAAERGVELLRVDAANA